MFEYDFMIYAFLSGIMIAILSSMSGAFIVLKRYSLLSETLAHSSLVGVAVGILLGLNPYWSSIVFAIIAAWLIEFIRVEFKIYSDAILAIFLSGSLALAVIIVSLADSFNNSLFSYLFGSILSVSEDDLIVMLVFSFFALGTLLFIHKELYFISYDEELAKASGLNVKFYNYLLVSIVAIVIALSIQIVGSLLIGALMVIPTISSLRLKKGLYGTLIFALLFSIISVIVGISLSYYMSVPSGASIVVVLIIIFIGTLFKK